VYLKVEAEELDKDKINTITEDVEKKYKGEDLEIVFLYIHEEDEIKASVNIPYNDMGMVLAGTDKLEYKIEYK
jgi:hypothetical protein